MDSGNAIIIALIAIIIVVAGAFFFINANGISLAPQEPALNDTNNNTTSTPNINPTNK